MDYLLLLCYPLLYTAVAAWWIFGTEQPYLLPTAETIILVTVKILILTVGVLYVAYGICGLSATILLGLLPFTLILIGLASFEHPSYNGPEALAILLTLLFPVYLCKQFVLGFPDRHKLFLDPSIGHRTQPVNSGDNHELVGATGTVSATLRPMGSIKIQAQEYSAKTDTGCLLDVGTAVTVVRVRNGVLEVRLQE